MSIPIPLDVQEIMAEIAGIAFAARNPKTNKPIKFQISKGHSYIYFRGKSGNDYCYTPHPDLDGWFYSFAYVGVGSGSRVGKAKRFTMKHLRCHRKRKDARNRALKLRVAEQKMHPTNGGLSASDSLSNENKTVSQLWSETPVMNRLLPPGENEFTEAEVINA